MSEMRPHDKGVLPAVTIVPFSTGDHPKPQLFIEPQRGQVGRPNLETRTFTPLSPSQFRQMDHEPGPVSLPPRRFPDGDVVDPQLAVHYPDVGISDDLAGLGSDHPIAGEWVIADFVKEVLPSPGNRKGLFLDGHDLVEIFRSHRFDPERLQRVRPTSASAGRR